MTKIHAGLEDICVAATRLSAVDGQRGELIIAGMPVESLAREANLAAAAARLWAAAGLDLTPTEVTARLATAIRKVQAPTGLPTNAMAALRGALGQLVSTEDDLRDALAALACAVVTTAELGARQRGRRTSPSPALDGPLDPAHYVLLHAGAGASPPAVRALHSYWATVCDHGLNASTFTARVVASTHADMIGALTAATCALAGPLHGGAPGPVLDMLDAIATPAQADALTDAALYDRAHAWLSAQLAAKQRIMGMGHRIYRVRDPRAAALETAIAALEREAGATSRMRVARQTEAAALALLQQAYPDRELCANVEFYTAVLLDALGLPRELFTALFACGRIVGWSAHVMEQRRVNKLIRPSSIYVGQPAGSQPLQGPGLTSLA